MRVSKKPRSKSKEKVQSKHIKKSQMTASVHLTRERERERERAKSIKYLKQTSQPSKKR